MMTCKNCGLSDTCIVSKVKGIKVGKNPKVMIVNSIINFDNIVKGKLEVPPLIEHYLYANDIKDYYYTNQVKCDTIKHKSKVISKDILLECDKLLLKEIDNIKPTHIMTIGKEATWMNTGKSQTKQVEFIPTHTDRGIIYAVGSMQDHKLDYGIRQFHKLIKGIRLKELKQNLKIIDNIDDLHYAINKLRASSANTIGYDIESQGLDRHNDKIVAFGFGDSHNQYIIPLDIRFSPLKGRLKLQRLLVRTAIKELNKLSKEGKLLTAGNGKFDNLFLEHHFGIKPHLDVDVVLDSHCLDETTPNDVKSNAMQFLDVADWDVPLEIKTGKGVTTPNSYNQFIKYLGYDVLYEAELGDYFHTKVAKDKRTQRLSEHIYMPSVSAYEGLEKTGVFINANKYHEQSDLLKEKQAKLEADLNRMIKREVKWNSSKEIQRVLYEDLGLPVTRTTPKGSPSTDVLVLKQLHLMYPDNEVLSKFMEYRSVSTLIGMFIDGWKDKLVCEDRNTYKLYPTFNVHGTRTGRTSSQNPNLQQVPKNKDLRSLIYAPPGWVFLEADYSQLELRVAAYISRDKTMLDAYMNNKDIHSITYENIFGPLSNDKLERYKQRTNAKSINFGFVYSMHAPTYVTTALKGYDVLVTLEEAEYQRKKYFETYPGLLEWHKRAIIEGKKKGYVESPLGRYRLLPQINSTNKWKALEDERRAINSPVQGLGSDFMLCALSEICGTAKHINPDTRVDLTKCKPIGTVHDALLALVREDYTYEGALCIKSIMEDPLTLRKVFNFKMDVPLVADITIGKAWGMGEEIDFSRRPKKQIKDIVRRLQNE